MMDAPYNVPDAAFPPIALADVADLMPDNDEMLSRLASNMATQERIFQNLGFGPIRKNWLRHAARLGEVVTARTGREEVMGTFDSIDEAGQLVLITSKGPRAIPAADVFF